ncbi:MAG: sulfatase-like hydrolase/transferase [Flavobacteriales bacterium]|nr:sulfatase-like hydrolase/transferase [Flavobacteriales bacterium]
MILFAVGRWLFLFSILGLLDSVPRPEIFESFYAGLRLDLSTAAYLLLPSIPLLILFNFTRWNSVLRSVHILNRMLIIVYCLICFGELALYQEWHTKLNTQALSHFQHPAEVLSSASWQLLLLFCLPLGLFAFLYLKLYDQWLAKPMPHPSSMEQRPSIIWSLAFPLISVPLLIILIRGGVQAIPITESDPYYSKHQPLNDAALNPLRHLAKDALESHSSSSENPYLAMPNETADRIVSELFRAEKDTTVLILKDQRPNVVLILLESWNANVCGSFGGLPLTPFFDSLAYEGIRFSNFYPAAYVSDQGIPAVLSGYPATSRVALVNDLKKVSGLPCLSIDMGKNGYETGFLFGGELNYGNLKGYLINRQFDHVTETADLPADLPRGDLGVHDYLMAEEFASIIHRSKQPFFQCWFTLSSHSPYDFEPAPDSEETNDYVGSIRYADRALRHFFQLAKKEPWFENTLFILVPDHSHGSPANFDLEQKEYHHIPLVFYGNPIKEAWRKREIGNTFSQNDIATTLLKQLGMETEQYHWGKDMFNPYSNHFAYYCFYYGSGWVTDSGSVTFHHSLDEPLMYEVENDEQLNQLTRQGRAFQQAIYNDLLSR